MGLKEDCEAVPSSEKEGRGGGVVCVGGFGVFLGVEEGEAELALREDPVEHCEEMVQSGSTSTQLLKNDSGLRGGRGSGGGGRGGGGSTSPTGGRVGVVFSSVDFLLCEGLGDCDVELLDGGEGGSEALEVILTRLLHIIGGRDIERQQQRRGGGRGEWRGRGGGRGGGGGAIAHSEDEERLRWAVGSILTWPLGSAPLPSSSLRRTAEATEGRSRRVRTQRYRSIDINSHDNSTLSVCVLGFSTYRAMDDERW